MISEAVDPAANIISGMVIDEGMEEEMKVTVIATGFKQPAGRRAVAEARRVMSEAPFFTPRPQPGTQPAAENAPAPAAPAVEPIQEEPEEIPFYRKVIAQTQGEDPNGYSPNWSNVDDFDIPTVLRKQMD